MNNPFLSILFKKKFISHFIEGRSLYSFDFIDGIEFYKHSLFSLYINIGRNLTKGLNYKFLSSNKTNILGNKTCFIYDVPDYINTETELLPVGIVLLKVKQYPGYYIDLSSFHTIDSYLKGNISKTTRYKLRKYRRRLENSFNIRYITYHGDMEKSVYIDLFISFFSLLKKRYSKKQIWNNNLDPQEWAFYEDVAYEMILNKKATLFVIYEQDNPISISLNYLYDSTLINAITVFDTDYSVFHVGSVAIWTQLEWCLENKIRVFDFSKGRFEYKVQWATNEHQFEHHIVFNKKSLLSTSIALSVFAYHTLKQIFRNNNLNEAYHKIRFKIKNFSFHSNSAEKYTSLKIQVIPSNLQLNQVNRNDADHSHIKQPLNSFIYLNQEPVKDIDIFYDVDNKVYYFKGKNTIERIRYAT
jgi:hypothetical protein